MVLSQSVSVLLGIKSECHIYLLAAEYIEIGTEVGQKTRPSWQGGYVQQQVAALTFCLRASQVKVCFKSKMKWLWYLNSKPIDICPHFENCQLKYHTLTMTCMSYKVERKGKWVLPPSGLLGGSVRRCAGGATDLEEIWIRAGVSNTGHVTVGN